MEVMATCCNRDGSLGTIPAGASHLIDQSKSFQQLKVPICERPKILKPQMQGQSYDHYKDDFERHQQQHLALLEPRL